MGLSEIDRNLLERCLQRRPRAWEDFVDRFMGLVLHVVHHTAQARSMRISTADRDDLCGDVFLAIIADNFAVLRNFRGQSQLGDVPDGRRPANRGQGDSQTPTSRRFERRGDPRASGAAVDSEPAVEQRLSNHEEVARLLGGLQGTEAEVVRMFHLEGKSYHEISDTVGMPENSIGPILSRARNKMRRAGVS